MRQRLMPSNREQTLKSHLDNMEDQMKLAMKYVKEKHDAQQRLNILIEREGKRFRLRLPNPEMTKKNQIYFERARRLPTFVDCKDLIQKTNLLNDTKMLKHLRSIKTFAISKHLFQEELPIRQAEQDFLELDNQEPFPTKQQIEQLGKKQKQQGYQTIDLVGQLPRTKSIDPSSLQYSKALIQRARQAIECLQTYQDDNLHYQLDKHIRSEFTEQELEPEFYRMQINKMLQNSPKDELSRKCLQKSKSLSKQIVKEVCQSVMDLYAIDIENNQIDLKSINMGFQTKSRQVVNYIKKNGIRKLSENDSSRIQQQKYINYTDRTNNDTHNIVQDANLRGFALSPIRKIQIFNPASIIDGTHKIIKEVEQTYQEIMQEKIDDKNLLKSLAKDIDEIENKITKKTLIKSWKIENHIEDLNYCPAKHSKVNHQMQALKKHRFSNINNFN